MSVSKYITLLRKKLNGTLSSEDQKQLDHWSNEDSYKGIDRIWEMSSQYKKGYQPDVEAGLKRFKARLAQEEASVVPMRKNNTFLRVAAAVVLVMALSWLWRNYLDRPAQELYVSTTAEEKLEVNLPDGSVVVLNQNSSLRYPSSFDQTVNRSVELEGEAFFDIQSNPDKPFLIHTAETDVKVLGTSFNVRAYPKETFTEVDVVSGKVAFASRDQSHESVLLPKEKATFQHSNPQIQKIADETQNAHSWRTQQLRFRNTPMSEVLNALERHFDIAFEVEDAMLKKCNYTSNFEEEELDNILAAIELSFNLSFSATTNQNIKVSGKAACK